MAKSATECQRERRLRLKHDPRSYDKYKKRDRVRKTKARKDMSPAGLCVFQKRSRLAVQRHRAKQSNVLANPENVLSQSHPIYKTPASLGKAKSRALRALPNSPRKRTAIVRTLAWEILDAHLTVSVPANKLSPNVEQTVLQFYENDSVSRIMPGKDDYLSIHDDECGKKVKKQKRHLIMTISETYQNFKQDHPDCYIGKSKFAALRPKWVLLSSDMPHNVCGCKYHNNVILLLESLHRKYPNVVPLYLKESFTAKCVCDMTNDDCMSNNCDKCADSLLFNNVFKDNVEEDGFLKWYQWTQDGERYIEKKISEGSTLEAFDELSTQLPSFFWHSFIKDKQATSYNHMKSAASDSASETCLLQMDFSENFTTTWQDEIQSAHWRQRQITIYTIMIYHREHKLSYVMVSDSTDHEKSAVTAFTSYTMEIIQDKLPTVKSVQIWTDGPSSQYKNKFIFVLTNKLQDFHTLLIQWNYFATSHGKGPNDGLGGNVKRIVHRMIMSRNAVVTNAASFVAALQVSCSNISAIVVTQEDILKRCHDMGVEVLWKGLSAFKQTRNTHCVKPNSDGTVTLMYYTDAIESITARGQYAKIAIPETSPETIDDSTTKDTTTHSVSSSVKLPQQKVCAQKRKKSAVKTSAVSICPNCNVCYGAVSDPKATEDWICCQVCKSWFHETCGEDSGIIDDDEQFTCKNCL